MESAETGLAGRIVQQLFVIPYKYGLSTTYLVAVDDHTSLHIGYDPEERDVEHQKLADVAWQPLNAMGDNPEIEALKQALAKLVPFSDLLGSRSNAEDRLEGLIDDGALQRDRSLPIL